MGRSTAEPYSVRLVRACHEIAEMLAWEWWSRSNKDDTRRLKHLMFRASNGAVCAGRTDEFRSQMQEWAALNPFDRGAEWRPVQED